MGISNETLLPASAVAVAWLEIRESSCMFYICVISLYVCALKGKRLDISTKVSEDLGPA